MTDGEKSIKIVVKDNGEYAVIHLDNGYDVFNAAVSFAGLEKLKNEIGRLIEMRNERLKNDRG